jgi:hypothetical protein
MILYLPFSGTELDSSISVLLIFTVVVALFLLFHEPSLLLTRSSVNWRQIDTESPAVDPGILPTRRP